MHMYNYLSIILWPKPPGRAMQHQQPSYAQSHNNHNNNIIIINNNKITYYKLIHYTNILM